MGNSLEVVIFNSYVKLLPGMFFYELSHVCDYNVIRLGLKIGNGTSDSNGLDAAKFLPFSIYEKLPVTLRYVQMINLLYAMLKLVNNGDFNWMLMKTNRQIVWNL